MAFDLDDEELYATKILHGIIKVNKEENKMSKFEIAETYNSAIDEKNIVIPKRATTKSAGYDLVSPVHMVIPAHGRALVPTGITCKMVSHEYLQIVPRSGLALKKGITVLNTPGTVDSDYYPNEIGVILYNTSDEDFEVNIGDRIAQAILQIYGRVEDDSPFEKKRDGGFGSTGRS